MSHNAVSVSTLEESVSKLDTITAAEAEAQSSVRPPTGSQSRPTPLSQRLTSPDDQEDGPEQDEQPLGLDQEQGQEPEEDPAPVPDWRAIRSKLSFGKSSREKMDWMRGWSEEVGAHFEAAYCACSGPIKWADPARSSPSPASASAPTIASPASGVRASRPGH